MKSIQKALLLFILLSGSSGGKAQDIVYSQFYANPVYLNPALAGSKVDQRITLNYRNQWPGIQKGYISYSATWDQHFDAISGALGVMVNTDVAGGGVYNRFSTSGIYAYRFNATKNIDIKAAIQVGYVQYKLDWDKLVLGDQMIDISTGTLEPTHDYLPPRLTIGNVDFSTGLLAGYKGSAFLGVAVNHLTRPDISFYETGSNRIDLRWTVHTGMLIDFNQGMDGADLRNFSISPNIVYVQQGKFHQLNAGMYVNNYPFVAGLWMRHNFGNPDAFIVLLGFQQKSYKIGYSFDYTISRLTIRTGGAHEISVAYIFQKPLKPSRFHKMNNPDF
jgi:type IX secretion system PorP/SprF family membrane protein